MRTLSLLIFAVFSSMTVVGRATAHDTWVERVPCLIWSEKEAFTGNRMVNRLSHAQEMRMLRKPLEELDEKRIAGAFGISSIGYRTAPAHDWRIRRGH